MKYQSNRKFRIWHYIVSHSTLIIRSEKQYEDVEYPVKYDPNCTLDIELSGVEFISLPDSFDGLKIRKEENGIYRFNENTEYYVKASSCRIGVSQFDHTQDRISDSSLKYDEILMSI
ncbi:hypothetical protein [Thalassobellus sediminis]|uniref:hypothetical protein n=1 Tax=Thalassobellus sediminis TaxID=3367753 RepID=UPI00379F4932